MFKKKATHYYSVFCLSLIVGVLAGAMPALGQDDDISAQLAQLYPFRVQDGFRLGVMGGTCFHADASSQSCPVVQVDLRWIPGGKRSDNTTDPIGRSNFLGFNSGNNIGWLRPRLQDADPGAAGAGGQGTVTASLDNTWPEPDPDPDDPPTMSAKQGDVPLRAENQLKSDHNGTITGLAELVLVMPIQPHFSLTPFAGVGITRIREGTAEAPNRYALEGQTLPSVSYGAEIGIRVAEQVDLRLQFRGLVHFPKTLTYIDAQGVSFTQDVATVSTSSLLIGMGYRF